MSNTFGNYMKITIFDQSHAPAIGMTLENFPAGFSPDFDELQAFMAKRAPGQGAHTTSRKEPDRPEFMTGIVDGHTCGSPITALIFNQNQHSKDYSNLADTPRPSHADYPAHVKYGGSADMRGGGPFSGRMTAPLCIAGGLSMQYLKQHGVTIGAHILQIGTAKDTPYDPVSPNLSLSGGALATIDSSASERMLEEIIAAKNELDSIGGIVECAILGLPVGIGEPMFGGMENRLSQAMFGIPAVKGIEFGSGFACAAMRGSQHNDPFYYDGDVVRTSTNNAGGILGGLTNGMPIVFRVAFKPTPSISRSQHSIHYSGGDTELEIVGRHDPCIVPRAVPCVEAAAAFAVLDALLEDHAI